MDAHTHIRLLMHFAHLYMLYIEVILHAIGLFSNLALASIVSWDNALILVLETSDDPGSLKAMCPSGPMPVQQQL